MRRLRQLLHAGAAAAIAVGCVGAIGIVPASDAMRGASIGGGESQGGSASYEKTQFVYAVPAGDGSADASSASIASSADAAASYDWTVSNVFAVTAAGSIDDITDDAAGTTQHIDAQPGTLATQVDLPAGVKAWPWTVRVTYSLDGPDIAASKAAGASGMIGVRIRVEPNPIGDTRYGADALLFITFTVPHGVTDGIAVPDGAVVSDDGDSYRVSALGVAGAANEWDCYMNATAFRMGRVIVAGVPIDAGTAGAGADATSAADAAASVRSRVTALAANAGSLMAAQQSSDGGAYADLIGELTALRDRERAAGAQDIAAKHDAYVRTFGIYIDRYVRSYASHMSGTPGTKTQIGALIGMTGELTGSTPLAQSVTDLANAVNAMSAAHQHDGAADIIDDVIRQIQRHGTRGLAADLKARQTKESAAGSMQYANGQGQLANAMIPFSMAYTDAFTAHRNDGDAVDAAIAHTNADFSGDAAMQRYTTQISAALKTMAKASERTGAAAMLGTLADRYGARFDDAANAADAGNASADGSAESRVTSTGPVALTALASGQADSAIAALGGISATSALRADDATTLLQANGSGTDDDALEQISDCASDLQTAIDTLLPEGAAPADAVSHALAGSAARVAAGSGAADAGDVIAHGNAHTVAASFLLTLPAVGDEDAIAADGGDGSAASQIPGLGAIVGKFMQ